MQALLLLLCVAANPLPDFVEIKLKPDAPEAAKAFFKRCDGIRRGEIDYVRAKISGLENKILGSTRPNH